MSLILRDIRCRVNSNFEVNIPFLKIESNEILGILGSSGSGKSSLLNTIAGFLDHTGEIILNNINIHKLSVSNRKLAYVLQEPSLFDNKTIGDNISFSSSFSNKKEKFQLHYSLCDKVGLKKDFKESIKSLSGGEKQRVNIARSLVSKPAFFMFDEAFNQLDAHTKIDLYQKIKEILTEENLGAIMVSHDLSDLKKNCDRIAIMENGEIIQTGTFEEIYKYPKNEYTANISGRWNKLKGSICEASSEFIGIRPENILLDKGPYKGVIIEKLFNGPYFEYNLQFGCENLVIYSSIEKELNDQVSFSFDNFFTLY